MRQGFGRSIDGGLEQRDGAGFVSSLKARECLDGAVQVPVRFSLQEVHRPAKRPAMAQGKTNTEYADSENENNCGTDKLGSHIPLQVGERKAKQRSAASIEIYLSLAVKKAVVPTVRFSDCWTALDAYRTRAIASFHRAACLPTANCAIRTRSDGTVEIVLRPLRFPGTNTSSELVRGDGPRQVRGRDGIRKSGNGRCELLPGHSEAIRTRKGGRKVYFDLSR